MTFGPRLAPVPRGFAVPNALNAVLPKQPPAAPITFTSPVAGLQLDRDPAFVDEGGALVLDNMVCGTDSARVRGGSTRRNTGLGGEVRSIMTYVTGASQRAFAVTESSIFDITGAGAVGAALVTGLASTTWSAVQFAVTGGVYLVACGSGNTRRLFDGTSWATTPAITGVTVSNLSQVWGHASRLFFVEAGTTNAWYLPVDSVGGAATRFPLGGEFPRGGSLVAGATWVADASSSGLQAQCAFLSSEGDLVTYSGSDPASWSRTGTYQIGKPLGINCFMKSGGDLLIMTEDGIVAMSQVVKLDVAALAANSVSRGVRPLWRSEVEASNRTRWQITRRDSQGYAIISNGRARQFVANLQTGAWSTFSGWAPTAMATFGNDLIFGTAGGIILTGELGGTDDSVPYTATYIGPFRTIGTIQTATAMMGRASIRGVETFAPKVTAMFDYSTEIPTPPQSAQSTGLPRWDQGFLWDAGWRWVGEVTRAVWQAVSGFGSSIAPCVQWTIGQEIAPRIALLRTDLVLEASEVVA